RLIRLVRLLRLLKVIRYSESLRVFTDVCRMKKSELQWSFWSFSFYWCFPWRLSTTASRKPSPSLFRAFRPRSSPCWASVFLRCQPVFSARVLSAPCAESRTARFIARTAAKRLPAN
ncbi:uncharacterized protein METZ01_LOCUS338508, partial [marine metagenome]